MFVVQDFVYSKGDNEMNEMVKKLKGMGINAEIKERTIGNECSKILYFPETVEKNCFLVGKIKENEFYLHQKIGLSEIEWCFGTFDTMNDSKLQFIYHQYQRTKEETKKMYHLCNV